MTIREDGADAHDDTALLRELDATLDRLLDLDESARPGALAAIASVDPSRAERLSRMLAVAAHRGATDVMAGHRSARLDALTADRSGDRLGPWQLDLRVAAGGMGVVYRGHRADGAFEKIVAIKLLAPFLGGLDAWFRREIALLARLDHPGIARLLDGGTDGDGCGYLVMEWIEGRDLDQFAADDAINFSQRLAVFDTMLSAAAHAHQHLVVHRDLKPANVRVDTLRQPKLLDFGIAVLLDDDAVGAQPLSAYTPDWAAPEQCVQGTITTRTDVHALGRLLILLLGADAKAPETLRPEQLRRAPKSARHELAAIIGRACAADPAHRYADASSFRDDLHRFHQGFPLRAIGDGWWYRTRCFVARHHLGVAAATFVALVLVMATAYSWRQASAAEAARDAAVLESRRADSVREFLQLSLRDAADLSGADIRLRDALKLASQRVANEYRDDPVRAVDVLISLAELHNQLGDYRTAMPLIERGLALSATTQQTEQRAALAYEFGVAAPRLGRAEEALPLLLQAEHYWAAQARFVQKHGQLLQLRGRIERSLGRVEAGVASTEAGFAKLTADVLTSPRDLGIGEVNLGASYLQAGQIGPARQHFEQGLARFEQAGLLDTPMALDARNNLAATLGFEGRYREAVAQFDETVRRREQRLGASAALGSALSNQAKMALAAGDATAARILVERALPMLAQFVGDASPDYAAALIGAAECALAEGDATRAAREATLAHAKIGAALGDSHPMNAVAASVAARATIASGQRDAGLTALREAVERLTAAGPGLAQQQAQSRVALAKVVLDDASDEAGTMATAVLDLPSTALPVMHPLRIEAALIVDQVHADFASRDQHLTRLAELLHDSHPRVQEWRQRLSAQVR
ncbi:MAG TPA: serine/threonine-protein kinase [Pseudomonadota bacterium]|nr:serine/threonine protein kinase [Xanthomonadales bacterium]HQW81461.1 serine/threonine-protein kinase [Pseudomonadota bacterium]